MVTIMYPVGLDKSRREENVSLLGEGLLADLPPSMDYQSQDKFYICRSGDALHHLVYSFFEIRILLKVENRKN